MKIKIIVAAHKYYWMPTDRVYLPLHVGAENKLSLGFIGDNTGDNISAKNPNYCELTGLYWAWKNLDSDYIGLCHYRRYFAHPIFKYTGINKKKSLLKEKDYIKLLKKYDVILPIASKLKGYTVRTRYEYGHKKRDLDEVEKIIIEFYPEFLTAFNTVMNSNTIYFCNMFVMKKELVNEYCNWLFDILFKLEKRIDISEYDNYQARVYGFLGERLFNVWLYHKNLKKVTVKTVFLEECDNGGFLKRLLRYLYYRLRERLL